MPELPEVEITARLLDGALAVRTIEVGARSRHQRAEDLRPAAGGARRPAHRRRAAARQAPDRRGRRRLALLVHLMSAGRLQLFEKPAGPRDRTSRLLVRVRGGRARPRRSSASCACASSAPSRRPGSSCCVPRSSRRTRRSRRSGPKRGRSAARPGRDLLDAPRPLHALLRDQHTIAGIGRSWVDEILWQAQLSPYKRGADLDADELARLGQAIVETPRATRSPTTSRPSACRSPTSCRCRCACTATRASRARAARRSSRPSTSRTT